MSSTKYDQTEFTGESTNLPVTLTLNGNEFTLNMNKWPVFEDVKSDVVGIPVVTVNQYGIFLPGSEIWIPFSEKAGRAIEERYFKI